MNYQDQFTRILEKERGPELLPFFKSLNNEQKQSLIPYLRTICKEYLEYAQDKKFGSITFKRKASEAQAAMLSLSAFVCFTRKEFEKTATFWSIEKNRINEILDWYCPKWFNDYINSYGGENFVPFFISYDWIIELSERKLIAPSKELIVKILPQTIFEQTTDHKSLVKPENLLKHAVTLNEHIWYFFELENNIYASDRYLSFADNRKRDESQWMRYLKEFSSEGKLDRHRLLKESISGTTRNFNKPLVGWFAELFTTLEPTKEELLSIQPQVLNALNSNQSKPVNVALNAIKKIADESGFQVNTFLEAIPLLLSSETKAIVNSTLSILEKLAKKYSDKRTEITITTCQAFLHAEDDTQTKASKLIQKYGSVESDVLKETLFKYHDSLLVNARNNLTSFLSHFAPESQQEIFPSSSFHQNSDEQSEIKEVDSLDELIFLSSQAFDNNKSYHLDILAAALIKLNDEIKGDSIEKFDPSLQRAFNLVMDGWTTTTGYLDHLLATFFIDYSRILIKRDPVESTSLLELHKHYAKKEAEHKANWAQYASRILPLKEWKTHNRDTIYEPYKNLLSLVLKKIESNDSLPLLSTPTHEPAFISPVVLIRRLKLYSDNNQLPDLVDFQIAVSRCNISNSEQKIDLVEQSLKGELKNILLFLLTQKSRPVSPFKMQSVWMVSGITKSNNTIYDEFKDFPCSRIPRNYLTGQFSWKSFDEAYFLDRYYNQKRKYEKVNSNRKILRIDFDEKKYKDLSIKNLLSKFLGAHNDESPTIYEFMTLKSQSLLAQHNDMARILSLVPNNPEPILAQVISKALKYSNFWEANDQKLVINTLQALVDLQLSYGETGHLLIATCMLSADKTVQSFAAELWTKGTSTNRVNTILIGEILGKHESIEFAPLKRLTDLIVSNLINISPFHNRQLEILITQVLCRLPNEPITNLKKLLEIYYELISINKSSVEDNLLEHITKWNTSGSLKKVLGLIAKHQKV